MKLVAAFPAVLLPGAFARTSNAPLVVKGEGCFMVAILEFSPDGGELARVCRLPLRSHGAQITPSFGSFSTAFLAGFMFCIMLFGSELSWLRDGLATWLTWRFDKQRLSAKILDQHDVGLGEFVLNIKDRAAILRTGQSPTYVTIEIPNRDYFPGSEFQELHPAE